MYRRYYPNEEHKGEEQITKHQTEEPSIETTSEVIVPQKAEENAEIHHIVSGCGPRNPFQNLFAKIQIDDILLIALLFIFLNEQIEDDIMILIVVALLLIGI